MSFARWLIMGSKNYNAPLVSVVKLSGLLMSSLGGPRSPQARRYINIDRCAKWIKRAFHPKLRPAAVALAINCPGGSPVQTELIFNFIRSLRQETGIPVYTFAEDVAASGGYWLALSGDKIYAAQTSLVGSIGVIHSSLGAVEAAKKLGVERRVFTSGESKQQLDPLLPVRDDQIVQLRETMDEIHQTFQNVVRERRGEQLTAAATSTDMQEIFSGRVFSGNQGVKLGLIDGLGSLEEVMKKEFGDKTKFMLCSEPPRAGLTDLFGFGSSSSSNIGMVRDIMYGEGRGGVDMYEMMQSVEENALWSRFGVKT
jgi:signal peptide peptidase SppA